MNPLPLYGHSSWALLTGYAPRGAGTPGIANPGASNTIAGTAAGASSGTNANASGNGSAAELPVQTQADGSA